MELYTNLYRNKRVLSRDQYEVLAWSDIRYVNYTFRFKQLVKIVEMCCWFIFQEYKNSNISRINYYRSRCIIGMHLLHKSVAFFALNCLIWGLMRTFLNINFSNLIVMTNKIAILRGTNISKLINVMNKWSW